MSQTDINIVKYIYISHVTRNAHWLALTSDEIVSFKEHVVVAVSDWLNMPYKTSSVRIF